MSTSFEVLSESGDLLLEVQEYNVAWIPAGLIRHKNAIKATPLSPMPILWKPEIPSQFSYDRRRRMRTLYIGSNTKLMEELKTSTVHLESMVFEELFNRASGQPRDYSGRLFIIDLTKLKTYTLAKLLELPLTLFKSLIRLKPGRVLLLTQNASAIEEFEPTHSVPHDVDTLPLDMCVGSIAQGILRVFRNESALRSNDTMMIDVSEELAGQTSEFASIILRELYPAVERTSWITAYRNLRHGEPSVRFVPALALGLDWSMPLYQNGIHDGARKTKIVAITGFGELARGLAPYLVRSGYNRIAFISRTHGTDPKIIRLLRTLQTESPSAKFAYVQADVSGLMSTKAGLREAVRQFQVEGSKHKIGTVVHTAGIVKDAQLQNVNRYDFSSVLRPKVHGAWNLHVSSLDPAIADLDSFVMFSSISVSLGNSGQTAYVAANAFMDSLAAYRRRNGLPGVSLQIGAWESELIKRLDMARTPMLAITNENGMPIIASIISKENPQASVQVLAQLIPSRMKLWSSDTYFDSVLAGASFDSEGDRVSSSKSQRSVRDVLLESIRELSGLKENELLDETRALDMYGIDSIAFAQIRGRMMEEFGIEVPSTYLSNAFIIADIANGLSG